MWILVKVDDPRDVGVYEQRRCLMSDTIEFAKEHYIAEMDRIYR